MQDDAKPVAYRVDDLTAKGETCGCFTFYDDLERAEYHAEKHGRKNTKITPLYAHPPAPAQPADVDSGMSGPQVERAEVLWANLPTGREWTSLATHEKALACHVFSRAALAAMPVGDATLSQDAVELAERLKKAMDKASALPWRLGADFCRIHPNWQDGDGNTSAETLHKNGYAKTIATIGKEDGDWRGIEQFVADGKLIVEVVNALPEILTALASLTPSPEPVGEPELDELIEAAAALIIATDGQEKLRSERTRVLDALKSLAHPPATPPADADAGLVELVKLLADVLEKELGDRADPSLDEEELIGWLGEEYGRQTIAGRIRLNQARERLAALGQGGVR